MSGPKHVGDVYAGWRLLRWDYDGAPLEAECPGTSLRGPWTVEIDAAGDLIFDGLPYDGANPYVPGEVLRELVKDAIARGVWK